jgi:uncharacterized membrane protein YbhN (UPF0104 family)
MGKALKWNGMVVFKLVFVCLIFAWLGSRGYLDLNLFSAAQASQRLHYLVLAVGGIWAIMVLQTLRARVLFVAQEYLIPLRTFYGITWIGYFFSAFLPGGVTSDLIKFGYFQGMTNKSKTVTALLVLLDRVCGLLGLLVLVFLVALAMVTLFGSTHPGVKQYFGIASALMGFSVVGGYLLMLPQQKQLTILGPLGKYSVFTQLTEAFQRFRNKKHVLFLAVFLSLGIHFLFLVNLYLIQKFMYEHTLFSMVDMTLLFPFAMLVSVIPLSPQGVGLSQLAIISVASFLGFQNTASAVTIYTFIQVLTMVCFLSGFVPYLLHKRQSHAH